MDSPRPRKIARIFGFLVTAAGVALLVIFRNPTSVLIPLSHWRLGADIVQAAGAGLVALGLLLCVLPVRLGLFTFSVIYSSLGIFIAGARPPEARDTEFRLNGRVFVWTSRHDYFENGQQGDARYGFRGLPNISRFQHSRDFDVTYHHDAQGWRVMPSPTTPPPHPEIVFLGCSFTYGIGVADDQSFAAILAREAWPEYRVRNFGFSAYGTTHSYLVLEDYLKSGVKPVCVIYAFSPVHLERNGLRASWHQNLGTSVPQFNEKGEYQGTIPKEHANLPDNAATDAREIQITRALLGKMQMLCHDHHVPFVILRIQPDERQALADAISELGIPLIDVTEHSTECFPHDGHFTVFANRAIARAIAESPLLSEYVGDKKLHQPGKVTENDPPLLGWRTSVLIGAEEVGFRVGIDPRDPQSVRVEGAKRNRDSKGQLELFRDLTPIEVGKRYEFTLSSKADKPTETPIAVTTGVPPRTPAGFWSSVKLTNHWRRYRFEFTATAAARYPKLMLYVDESTVPFEIADVRFSDGAPALPDDFHLVALPPGSGNGARGRVLEGSKTAVRIDEIISHEHVPWHLQVEQNGFPLKAGGQYVLHGQFRADETRQIHLAVQTGSPPFKNLGLSRSIKVDKQWKTFEIPFQSQADETNAALFFRFGESDVPFEFDAVELLNNGVKLTRQGSPSSQEH
ncbi:MAG: hypothetical protein U1D30_02365 [Planctomycetota bacterium]